MKRMRLGLLILLSLAACQQMPPLLDDTLLHDDSLYSGEPCAPPCFRGITPGETSWVEALTIIEDDSEFQNLQRQGPQEGSSEALVTWRAGEEGGRDCCRMVTQDGETVAIIFLQTAPDHRLGELIAAHGEPRWLAGQDFPDDSQAVVSLLYPQPDRRFMVYAHMAERETAWIDADSPLIGTLYLDAPSLELLLQTSSLHEWTGYGSYSDYIESEFEVTPSITLTPAPE